MSRPASPPTGQHEQSGLPMAGSGDPSAPPPSESSSPASPPVASAPARPPRRHAGPPRQAGGRRWAAVATTGALALIILYQIVFNLLPDGLRLQIAAAITGLLILMPLAMLPFQAATWRIGAYVVLAAVPLCWLLAAAMGHGSFSLEGMARTLLPFVFGMWLLEYREQVNRRVLLLLCAVTVAYAAAWAMIQPLAFIGHIYRANPFTGGEEGAHPAAYVVVLCLITFHQLKLRGAVKPLFGWFLIGAAAVMLVALRVSTPILMTIVYLMFHAALTWRISLPLRMIGAFAMFLMIFANVALHQYWGHGEVQGISSANVDELGSGRIGTWTERLQMLGKRSPSELLFGTGPGSDRFYSSTWWWEQKDSHNDFLFTVIESGLLGLAAMLIVLWLIFRRFGRPTWPLLAFLLAGSAVSNGLLARPLLFALFWMPVAIAASAPAPRRRRAPAPGLSYHPPRTTAPT